MTLLTLPADSKMRSPSFVYGVATASFQIEGAADKRLPCIWDTFCNTPGKIADNSTGEVACDHYRLFREDIKLIKSLGVDAYRLSLSWPRVIKKDGTLNQEGVNFYITLLDELIANDIKPYVTLYHWDLPQHLEDEGGWLNRDTAYKFQEYTDLITKAFGKRVFSYATLNEPFCSAYLGYEVGVHAPGKASKDYGKKAAHHLLLGHGLAMQVLKKNAPHALNGIVLNFTPCYPASDKQEDIAATSYADDYFNQWYIKPLFDKCYPAINEELPASQQPDVKPGDFDIISESMDYLGINFYTRAIYKADKKEIFEQIPPPEPRTDIGWEIYPQAFTSLLTSLNSKYDLPPIYITENGCANADECVNGVVDDHERLDYYQNHLSAVNDAINQGVNVAGYFAWSLMDNFEWAEGYMKRFGIVYVDYETQVRTIKKSGFAYRDFITQR